ncbi:BTAD domain-containing putative transcriptional regulator [Sphaerimonospora cavernae]|uniref:BTAD domain-containing putative transcriptional regulator n=1 Tax=Sphaerimonospora cavernae TaxID=1740611 RepID=A0ABV6U1L6_9ACTN
MMRFRLLDGLRALLATAVLVALILGVPVALRALAGPLLPAHLPSLDEIGHALTHRDDGTLFLGVVKVASWAAWAAFVVTTAVDVGYRLRGRVTPRLPGLGPAQWLSAQLISSVTLAVSSPAAFIVAAVPPAAVVATASVALADSAEQTTAPPDTAHEPIRLAGAVHQDVASPVPSGHSSADRSGTPDQAQARLVRLTHAAYQVRRGDCLWTIAQRHLGDGERYTEIVQLNQGRVMTDGARFAQPDLIHPGWVLRMPTMAKQLDKMELPGPDRHPGHPGGGPEFSRPHDGAIPAPSATAKAASPKSATSTRAGERAGAVLDARPSAESPSSASPGARQAQAVPVQPEPTVVLLTDGTGARNGDAAMPVAAAFAGGVAVGSLFTLARLRHAQRQSRRRGRRIALPADPGVLRAEQELRRLAVPEARARAREALARLGGAVAATRRDVPPVLGTRVSAETVEVLLARPSGTAPAPFTQGRSKATWRLDIGKAARPDDVTEALPALLTTGHLPEGQALLVNLEHLQVAVVSGPDQLADRLLVTAATELVTADGPWFDVLAVGFPELEAAGGRVRTCTDLAEAVGVLADRARELRGRLAQTEGPEDVAGRRLYDPDGDWALTVLISRDTPSADQMARLIDTVTALPGGLAALVPGGTASAPSRFALSQDDDGPLLEVAPLGLAVRPHLLSIESYERLGELFTIAGDTGDVAADAPPYNAYARESLLPLATGATSSSTAQPDAGQQKGTTSGRGGDAEHQEGTVPATDGDAKPQGGGEGNAGTAEPTATHDQAMDVVQVSILGPLEITGTAADLQPKMAELVLALALAGPPGLRNVQLASMMGPDPDTPKPSDQMRQLITRTRGKLGKTPDGQARILCDSAYVYRAHGIVLDWTRFQDLADRGAKRNSTADLWEALTLVRGPVLDGCYHWWLETPLIENIRAEIVDAADLLAELELDASRPDRSARAARLGLGSDQYAEQLWRALMRAEYEAGNMNRVHEAWKACLKAVAEVSADGDPHPETTALYRQLTSTRRTV